MANSLTTNPIVIDTGGALSGGFTDTKIHVTDVVISDAGTGIDFTLTDGSGNVIFDIEGPTGTPFVITVDGVIDGLGTMTQTAGDAILHIFHK